MYACIYTYACVYIYTLSTTSAIHTRGVLQFQILWTLLGSSGLTILLNMMLRLLPSGLLWHGLLCSSWIWIARNGTGRSADNPGGFWAVPRVCEGNRMVMRAVAVATIAWLRGVNIIFERPQSSLMWEFPEMKLLLDLMWEVDVRCTARPTQNTTHTDSHEHTHT